MIRTYGHDNDLMHGLAVAPLSPDQGHLWEVPRFDEFFGGRGGEGEES